MFGAYRFSHIWSSCAGPRLWGRGAWSSAIISWGLQRPLAQVQRMVCRTNTIQGSSFKCCRGLQCETPARIRAAMVGPQVGLLFANGMSLEQPSFHKTMPTYAICEALSVNHSWKYISDLTISHLNFPKWFLILEAPPNEASDDYNVVMRYTTTPRRTRPSWWSTGSWSAIEVLGCSLESERA